MPYDIQVYTPFETTSRLSYAVDLVLGNILGLSYIITSSPDDNIPLINYSDNRRIGGIFIQPEKLLFEEGIRKQDIWVAHLDGVPLFYQQPPEAGFVIDIFAFAFYMASRYEEYLTDIRDEHGRFAAESSLAYKHDFLDIPLVDIWSWRLGTTLKLLYPDLSIPEKKYSALMTVDLDQPYAFKGKGFLRNAGGLIKDMISGRKPGRRLSCLTGQSNDPYDTYEYINSTAEKYNSPLTYFFTTGTRSRYDKNMQPHQRCYKKLIRKLSLSHEIGLHTSYSSDNSEKLIVREKKRLERASRRDISKARKHYLLLTLPLTYQVLQRAGIEEDYTLGYIRESGFRAGIARPFRFYDLEDERESSILLVPFQYMDGTFQRYKRFSPGESKIAVKKLIDITREVGGLFVSVWHNTSLTEEDEWKGWRQLFEYTLREQEK
ncbi:MAG: polysaccharide deacetylase family protein [Bacteroidales bacterium]|nr:polysaccharide deacetylase family protein [Bacteroidales bacterium]